MASATTLMLLVATTSCGGKSEPDAISKDKYCGDMYEAHQNYQANAFVFIGYSSDDKSKKYLDTGTFWLWDGANKITNKLLKGTIHWADALGMVDLLLKLETSSTDLRVLLEAKSSNKQDIVAAIKTVDIAYKKAIDVCPAIWKTDLP